MFHRCSTELLTLWHTYLQYWHFNVFLIDTMKKNYQLCVVKKEKTQYLWAK